MVKAPPIPKKNRAVQGIQAQARPKGKALGPDPLRGMRTRVKIADCTIGFAIANRNPFAAYEGNCPPVCMPDNIVLPTYKSRIVLKGSGAAGTTGVGFVAFSPNVVSNNGNPVKISTSASVGTTAAAPVAFTNIATIQYSTARFGNASFGAGLLEGRVCAAAVRLRYTGTVLNAGGTVYAYRSPSNNDISAATLDSWINLPETKRYPFSREWVNLRWKISTPDEQNFDFATTAVQSMYIAVVSATGLTQPFEIEAVNFHEMVGSSSGAKTLSHSDPVGFGVVQALSTVTPDSNRGKGEHPKSILKSVEDGIIKGTSYVKAGTDIYKVGKSAYEGISEFASLFAGEASGLAAIGEEAGALALLAL